MKFEFTWRGVAVVFIITTLIFGFFAFINIFSKNTAPPTSSFLEQYLKTENEMLNREQDSLLIQIDNQKKAISEKDSLLLVLSNKKVKVKIVYYEKYQKIDSYSIRQLTTEFDSLFAKNRIN